MTDTTMLLLAQASPALMVVLTAAAMVGLALLFALVLGWANVRFHVDRDPRIDQVNAALPGANCAGCGYTGCDAYAEAVVKGEAPPDQCPVGGASVVEAIAEILGIDVEQSYPYRPVVHCAAHAGDKLKTPPYTGERTCFAANVIGGVQGCTYGCLGFGDCKVSCPFDAIRIVDGLATILYDRCTGCGACERACPRHIIQMIPFKNERMLVVACSNKDFGKLVKQVCKVGCIGCKACSRVSEIFEVNDNVATLDYDKYEPGDETFEVALNKCPAKGMIWVGEPSEKDRAAVADQEAPEVVTDTFKTTADDAQWRG